MNEEDGPALRAAVRMGLLTESFVHWEPDYPGEYTADGGDYIVGLTGIGDARLLDLNRSFLRRITQQIVHNLPTIIVSVLVTLCSAWLLDLIGPDEDERPEDGLENSRMSG